MSPINFKIRWLLLGLTPCLALAGTPAERRDFLKSAIDTEWKQFHWSEVVRYGNLYLAEFPSDPERDVIEEKQIRANASMENWKAALATAQKMVDRKTHTIQSRLRLARFYLQTEQPKSALLMAQSVIQRAGPQPQEALWKWQALWIQTIAQVALKQPKKASDSYHSTLSLQEKIVGIPKEQLELEIHSGALAMRALQVQQLLSTPMGSETQIPIVWTQLQTHLLEGASLAKKSLLAPTPEHLVAQWPELPQLIRALTTQMWIQTLKRSDQWIQQMPATLQPKRTARELEQYRAEWRSRLTPEWNQWIEQARISPKNAPENLPQEIRMLWSKLAESR